MDLTSVQTIRSIQKKFGFLFKKGFGQNFLTSKETLKSICEAVKESGAEEVLEIGPGFGVLTYELARNFSKVTAIELDKSLTEVLNYTLAKFDNVRIINGDALKLDLSRLINDEFETGNVSLAANLPYYAATQIIISVLERRLPLKSMVVMVQKEVAERICAKPSSKSYGVLSVICQYYTEASVTAQVTADKFVPPPKVDSTVVCLKPLEKPKAEVKNEELFFKVVRAAFSQRRKTLLNCLSSFFGIEKTIVSQKLDSIGIIPSRRGETLTVDEFARISDILFE